MNDEQISLRDYLDEKVKAHDAALMIANTNMERRLTELNKLRDDVIEDRRLFITAETYNATERERAMWREKIIEDLITINTRITIIETRSVTWTAALGIFFTLLQISLAVLLYYGVHGK